MATKPAKYTILSSSKAVSDPESLTWASLGKAQCWHITKGEGIWALRPGGVAVPQKMLWETATYSDEALNQGRGWRVGE